jgi:hypothetical protein
MFAIAFPFRHTALVAAIHLTKRVMRVQADTKKT